MISGQSLAFRMGPRLRIDAMTVAERPKAGT